MLLVDTAGCGMPERVEAPLAGHGRATARAGSGPAHGSRANAGEAAVVVRHVRALLARGIEPSEVAVVTPYNAQVRLVRDRLRAALGEDSDAAAAVEVRSVDGFQGREKEAIVLSLVRSNVRGEVGFLRDDRRLNVAVTRARRHVAVVCDSDTVGGHAFIASLIDHITSLPAGRGDVCGAQQYLEAPLYGGGGGDAEADAVETMGVETWALEPADEPRRPPAAEPGRASIKPGKGRGGADSRVPSGSASEARALRERVRAFAASAASVVPARNRVLRFPRGLSSYARMIVHEEAEALGLRHRSSGKGARRQITVSLPAPAAGLAPREAARPATEASRAGRREGFEALQEDGEETLGNDRGDGDDGGVDGDGRGGDRDGDGVETKSGGGEKDGAGSEKAQGVDRGGAQELGTTARLQEASVASGPHGEMQDSAADATSGWGALFAKAAARSAPALSEADEILRWRDVQEVESGLFLGSCDVERSEPLLRSLGITHILNVAKELSPTGRGERGSSAVDGAAEAIAAEASSVSRRPAARSYRTIGWADETTQSILPQMAECLAFIDAARAEGGKVLVHCAAGRSRSASVAIAHLVRGGASVAAALARLQADRPWVQPNEGFMRQLEHLEAASGDAAAAEERHKARLGEGVESQEADDKEVSGAGALTEGRGSAADAERPPPAPLRLQVKHGRETFVLDCHAEVTFDEVSVMLERRAGVAQEAQRLMVKGKDKLASVEGRAQTLGAARVRDGARMMLLARRGHHAAALERAKVQAKRAARKARKARTPAALEAQRRAAEAKAAEAKQRAEARTAACGPDRGHAGRNSALAELEAERRARRAKRTERPDAAPEYSGSERGKDGSSAAAEAENNGSGRAQCWFEKDRRFTGPAPGPRLNAKERNALQTRLAEKISSRRTKRAGAREKKATAGEARRAAQLQKAGPLAFMGANFAGADAAARAYARRGGVASARPAAARANAGSTEPAAAAHDASVPGWKKKGKRKGKKGRRK
jgi:protein-tyrosine phosphatase